MRLNDWQPSKPMTEISISDLKRDLVKVAKGKVERPGEMVLILLGHVLGQDKAWLLAHPEFAVDDRSKSAMELAWSRLCMGEPLAYITGTREFYGLAFKVNPHVLIPRPETELLVENALLWLREHPKSRKAIDIGTGSGCIAVSLASTIKDLSVIATDISPEALQVARQNALHHKVAERIRFLETDLLNGIDETFDLVCANLPYIPSKKLTEVNSIAFEPGLALDGGDTGLDHISRLLEQLPTKLNSPGCCLLEIEETLGQEVVSIARQIFPGDQVSLKQDLAGKDRLLVIERA